jgi:cysteinyl-tRNA synthetase
VDDFTYQLQNIDLAAIGRSRFDLAIIDYSSDGGEAGRFTAAQIAALQHSPNGRRIVLAYISIGEAEDYRWYWRNAWDTNPDGRPDAGAPSWLGPVNPNWPGNYKVRYWDPAWQSIIYGSPQSYVDKVMAAGFDGVYLDLVDAYEYWGPGGESGLNRLTAAREMVSFVEGITHYARITRGRPSFLVVPQNGEGLASYADYVQAVSGIGEEDTWYDGDTPQPPDHTASVTAQLDIFRQAGRLVLVTDYVSQPRLIDDFYARAQAKGYVPYATVRDLDRLTINPGHAP